MSGTNGLHTVTLPPAHAIGAVASAPAVDSTWKSLYTLGGVAALVALAANLLDVVLAVVLGFAETEVIVNGTKTAADWFALFQDNWFKGVYVLGILNIVYMAALVPVYLAIFAAHRHVNAGYAALAVILSFIGTAIYISNSAGGKTSATRPILF
jgi:hypothetical protein